MRGAGNGEADAVKAEELTQIYLRSCFLLMRLVIFTISTTGSALVPYYHGVDPPAQRTAEKYTTRLSASSKPRQAEHDRTRLIWWCGFATTWVLGYDLKLDNEAVFASFSHLREQCRNIQGSDKYLAYLCT